MNYLYDCNQLLFIKTTEHNDKLPQFIKELEETNIVNAVNMICEYN